MAACACGDAAETDPTVVASAGLTVAENAAVALETAGRWSVDLEPGLDLGTVDGQAAERAGPGHVRLYLLDRGVQQEVK